MAKAQASVEAAETDEARAKALDNVTWIRGVEKKLQENLDYLNELKKKNE